MLCCEPPRLLATAPDMWPPPAAPAAPASRLVPTGLPDLPADLWPDCAPPPPLPLRVAPRRPPRVRLLPPLQLPAPALYHDDDSSDEAWWTRAPERFSLPPLEPPAATTFTAPAAPLSPAACGRRAAAGVRKRARRRPRRSPAGRALARLAQRVVTGKCF